LDNFVPGSLRYFDDSDEVGILTIGDELPQPLGIDEVSISIIDNHNQDTVLHLHNRLYFSTSPVKIISVTLLAKHSNDCYETLIKMHLDRLIFAMHQLVCQCCKSIKGHHNCHLSVHYFSHYF
jgi:hypothetical protein